MVHAKEYYRSTKRRWTSYFVSKLTGQGSVAEVKLLNLAPLLIEKFRSLIVEFRDEDRKLYKRGFLGGSLFAIVTTSAFYVTFGRVVLRALNGALTVGDVAIYGGVTSHLRRAVESAILSMSRALGTVNK